MTLSHERIYLQVRDEEGRAINPIDGEITWCQDRINDSDVEYIRADLLVGLLDGQIEKDALLVEGTNIDYVYGGETVTEYAARAVRSQKKGQ